MNLEPMQVILSGDIHFGGWRGVSPRQYGGIGGVFPPRYLVPRLYARRCEFFGETTAAEGGAPRSDLAERPDTNREGGGGRERRFRSDGERRRA